MAMDDCEESLQEIDVTSFLNTLCGHMRVFRERGGVGHSPGDYPPTFIIRDGEEGRPEERPAVTSSSRCGSSVGMEDASEAESGKKPFDSGGDEETEASRHFDFPLKLLQTQPKCEVYPDLHRIIQVSWSGKMAQGGIRSPEEKNKPRVFISRRNSWMSSRNTSSLCPPILFTTSTVLCHPRKT